jgi:hypothetical protein
MKGKIRVYCRFRPLSSKELSEDQKMVVTAPDEFTVEHPWKDDKPKQHQFDHVFTNNASQDQVFEDTKVSQWLLITHFIRENLALKDCSLS